MRKNLFLVIVLAAAALLMTSCVEPSAPKANYLNYEINRVTLQGIEVNFNFEVENPNPLSIDVPGYSYKVFINDKEFLAEDRPGFSLPASAKKKITIPVNLRYEKIFGSALSVIERVAKGTNSVDYRIDGSLTAGTLGITTQVPLKASGTIPIPKELPQEIKF